MTDEEYMKLAIDLARKGCGYVDPNPMVGALVVKGGKIIGEGYHEKYGMPHAERNALASCTDPPDGASLYVTLEPCCHYGKTPPCTEAIIESGVARVIVGCVDPNPLIAGKGIKELRRYGVSVTVGVLENECTELNEVFFHYIKTSTPYVVMKYAMTIDGKTAAYTGKSRWVTGEAARRRVHEDRHRYASIMVGAGTVIKDDPLLTCRIEGGQNPVRIICDTRLRTPLCSQVVETAGAVPTIIATACCDEEKKKPYTDKNCEIMTISKDGEHIDLNELMIKLAAKKIDSVLLEGGATLNWSALQSGIVQKVQAYIAPKIFGGAGAVSPVGGIGVADPGGAFLLINSSLTMLDEDILIESEVKPGCSPA